MVLVRLLVFIIAALMVAPVHAEPEPTIPLPEHQRLLAAQEAVRIFGAQLKTELSTAMAAGGPVAAINVCQQRAPEIARELSDSTGFSLNRVSLKPRNPKLGPPNDWQTAVLTGFAKRAAKGEDPTTLLWHQNTDGEFRMMKAIPTAAICLTCHGQQLSAPVAKALANRYPGDQATGYRAGEIRGAFVVTQSLETGVE